MDNLPIGAEFDSNAPWNDDSTLTTTCRTCYGVGFQESEKQEYSEKKTCTTCDGEGKVEYELEYEPELSL